MVHISVASSHQPTKLWVSPAEADTPVGIGILFKYLVTSRDGHKGSQGMQKDMKQVHEALGTKSDSWLLEWVIGFYILFFTTCTFDYNFFLNYILTSPK